MNLVYRTIVYAPLLVAFGLASRVDAEPPVRAELVQVQKVWDRAKHNAFTDLVRWAGKWYCAFREGAGHAGDIGKMRVLASSDAVQWDTAALLALDGYDLRDAAISVMPDGRLMIMGGAQKSVDGSRATGTFVSYLTDRGATEPKIVIPPGRWLWRVTWHEGKAYGVSYPDRAADAHSTLHVTNDGGRFETIQDDLLRGNWPTEARIRFTASGEAICLHRRDGGKNSAMLGRSKSPYKEWTWSDLGVRFGGPNFLQTPSGNWIAVGRLYDAPVRTSICYLDVEEGTLTPLLDLPSGGDTSYPGLVWHDDQLWVSYYSSHEGKASIYLAQVRINEEGAADSGVREIGSRRELFVDRWLIDRLEGASLELQRPVDAGPVVQFGEPWDGAFCGYATVIHDDDLYRLYYRGLPVAGADGSDRESTCYAESADGVNWRKPKFDIYPTAEGRGTNRLLLHAAPVSHNFSPFKDYNPDADSQERYKAVGGTADSGLLAYVSADGIHWRKLRDEPIFRQSGWVFDSQNLCFWSVEEQCYVLYYRVVHDGVRSVARTTSSDFIHWESPTPMTYSDTLDVRPSQQLYTSQTHPYFRAPHLLISTAARFMPGRRALSDAEAERIGVHPSYYSDTSDAVLMTSRGGSRYDREFLSALIRPGIGAENWVSRSNYPALNIVPTSNTEMSLYVNQNYGQPTAHLRRYVFRTDGLAALHGPPEGGSMVTRPLQFEGAQLTLNCATSAAGEIRVGLLNTDKSPIEGFALDDCDPIIGNELERVVRWRGVTDVSRLAGQAIRLRFELQDADIYSMKFIGLEH